ncbi:MAG TPA: 2-C-methyl-D-erythritol 4-phosphate cytidylyltransferase [Chthoniobacteraceae bacterium]|nr:2-C-methyl-D-erythritol 4-phosphate cytidylyltransferase [Chthoniobacteraceae bacterium]
MIAVLVAAGSSRRMGFDKLVADLGGAPVAAVSLRAFEKTPSVRSIILVTQADRIAEFEAIGKAHSISKLTAVVAGGGERHLSVWNGLLAAEARGETQGYLAVHDAARPLVTPAAIEACLAVARQHGAGVCASPVADTLKRAAHDLFVTGDVDREHLWAMQTPQVFLSSVLIGAYRSLIKTGEKVTDEVSAVQRLGVSVALAPNAEPNFKITLPADLELARLVLKARENAL